MGVTDGAEIDDVTFDRSPQHGFSIRAATFPYLVRRSLHDFDTQGPVVEPCTFSSVFFLTYQWYLEPGELLNLYADRYKMLYLSDKEKERSKKLQICQTVSYWINNFGSDFKLNPEVRMQLLEFQNEVQIDIGNKAARLLDLEIWNVTKRSQRFTFDSRSQNSLSFHEISARDFAEHITYLDCRGIGKINFAEWRNYTKESKTDSSPNLQKQIALFNNISKWVIAMILQKESPHGRARLCKKFVQICRDLKEIGNYNSLMAVVGGLSNSILERMHKTKECLSNEDKLYMKEMLDLLSSDNNYSSYRNEVSKSEGFHLPILGVVMKDLIGLETAVSDFIEEKGRRLCNYKKMVQLSQVLHQIIDLAKVKPQIRPKQDLVNMLRVSLQPRYTDEELYELSLVREPRSESIGYRTLTRSSPRPVFAEWAAGVEVTPDRETVERYVDRMVEAVFKIYDKDRDDSINQAEFQSIATNFPFIDDFAMLDTNCDDSISREEMRNYFMNVNSHVMTRDFVHAFQEATIITPVLCVYCTGYLWGLGKSAYKCKECQIACHKDCKDHVVLQCKQKNHVKEKSPRQKSKTMKKRMKFLEQSFGGSTDSQISNGCDSSSPVLLKKTISVDATHHEEIQRLREKLRQSEKEQASLREENKELRSQLHGTKIELDEMRLQLSDFRQHTLYMFMKQMEMLNTKVQTDV